jgi:hypothetical protein
VLVKPIVEAKLGSDWIIPTLWHGTKLPPREARQWPAPFVLKANHASGWNYFVHNADDIDWPAAEKLVDKWLTSKLLGGGDEWLYQKIVPQVLVEPFMGGTPDPIDYKFFVFQGRVEYIQADLDRHTSHRQQFFDRKWQFQPFRRGYPSTGPVVDVPENLGRMIAAAELLAADFPFARVDLYEFDGTPKFGEVTFYPSSGNQGFSPAEWDCRFGDLWVDLDLDAYQSRGPGAVKKAS